MSRSNIPALSFVSRGAGAALGGDVAGKVTETLRPPSAAPSHRQVRKPRASLASVAQQPEASSAGPA